MPNLSAIILAAGAGTRMRSRRPKVLHPVAGRPMLDWVLEAVRGAGVKQALVVLGHRAQDVRRTLPRSVKTAVQARQLGTAHAVLSARAGLRGTTGDVLVVCGDAPLITTQTLKRLVAAHRRGRAAATVLTAVVAQPAGYGRVLREPRDPRRVAAIVEERDATPEQRRVREVNSGAYCFSLSELWPALTRVGNRNRKGEYYLTDVIAALRAAGRTVQAVRTDDADEILGINRRSELALAEYVCNRRMQARLMNEGVTIADPTATWIEPGVVVGADTVILPGSRLTGATVIGPECLIGPGAHIDASRLGARVKVRLSALDGCRVGDDVSIGPYSHLRPGTRIAPNVIIGNFAEINRSTLGRRVKMGHFSYLGDAVVGDAVNIGAGSITANYDGSAKHPTRIGAGAFIGSGTVIVAPSTIGAGALTGAGAVLKRGTHLPPRTVAVGVPARVIKKRDCK